eukprot:310156_1
MSYDIIDRIALYLKMEYKLHIFGCLKHCTHFRSMHKILWDKNMLCSDINYSQFQFLVQDKDDKNLIHSLYYFYKPYYTKIDFNKIIDATDSIKLISNGNDTGQFIFVTANNKFYTDSNWTGTEFVECGKYGPMNGNIMRIGQLHNFNKIFANITITKIECGCGPWCVLLTVFGVIYYANNKKEEVHKIPVSTGQDIRFKDISSGARHTLCLSIDAKLYGFGSNQFCQLGFDDREKYYSDITLNPNYNYMRVREIKSGQYHSIVIDIDDNCYVFGFNDYGQGGGKSRFDCNNVVLPYAPPSNEVYPCTVKVKIKEKIKQCAAGWNHSVLLTTDNKLVQIGKAPGAGLFKNPYGIQFDETIVDIDAHTNCTFITTFSDV